MQKGITRKQALLIALMLYILLGFVANWSILLGTNIMKWDIWSAEYPMQAITTDAMRSGTIPIWTPLMNFGTPYYAMIGTPVWYPVTLLIDFIGYGPFTPAIEYTIHMVIGAFGMFLLAFEHTSRDKKKFDGMDFAVPLCMGIFYEFTGVFLSNAEHVMILISTAWLPLVLLFSERYACRKRTIDLMTTTIIAGLILFGGYPEIFYNLFLVLFVWIFYWIRRSNPDFGLVKTGIKTILRTVAVAVGTLMFAAISIIPFMNLMPQITRSGGQILTTLPFSSILSAILPVTVDQINGYEISMGLYYIGIAVVLALPLILKSKNRESQFYLCLMSLALFLSFGSNSFLHTVLYRFFPIYSNFRFPTLWRSFIAIFALLAVVEIWERILAGDADNRAFGVILKAFVGVSAFFSLLTYLISVIDADPVIASDSLKLCNAFLLLLFIVAGYLAINYLVINKVINQKKILIIFVCVVIMETLMVAYKAFPVMAAEWYSEAYFQSETVQKQIDTELDNYNNRNTNCNFSGNSRTTSGLNSLPIAFNKTFDEEGYLSVALLKIHDYKSSYNRSITQQNPEAFFTNDIVDSTEIPLEQWREKPDISPYQIHVDTKSNTTGKTTALDYKADVVSEQELQSGILGENMSVEGPFAAKSDTATKIRLYFDVSDSNNVALSTRFVNAADGSETEYDGTYTLNKLNDLEYVDMSLPKTGVTYAKFSVHGDITPTKICLVELNRNSKDENIDIIEFGFNSIKIEVNAPTDGMLTVLQSDYSGWKAYVDHKRVVIQEVNGCFIGVPLESGKHEVVLQFQPKDLLVGALVTALYIAAYVIVIIVTIRRAKKSRQVESSQLNE